MSTVVPPSLVSNSVVLKQVVPDASNCVVACNIDNEVKARFYQLFDLFEQSHDKFVSSYATLISVSTHISFKHSILMHCPIIDKDIVREFLCSVQHLLHLEMDTVKTITCLTMVMMSYIDAMARLGDMAPLQPMEIAHLKSAQFTCKQLETHLNFFRSRFSSMYVDIFRYQVVLSQSD